MRSLFAFLLACISTLGMAQPIQWTFNAVPEKDGTVLIELISTPDTDWHIYATVLPMDEGPLPTEFRFASSDSYELVGALGEPGPREEYDPNFAMILRFHSGVTRFTQRIRPTMVGAITVEGELEYMCCNDVTCLPPLVVPFSIPVAAIQPLDK